MNFEYEIGPEEYVASQLLYLKLTRDRKRLQWGTFSIAGGVLFLLVGQSRSDFHWSEFLLTLMGIWWITIGFINFFPGRYYRRVYRTADLAGKKFTTNMNEDGFEVTGEYCCWRVRWPGVRLKGENERVFVICSAGTIFMFGKRYLADEQQKELRRFSGLVSS
ncbi:MAG TPA: hypothetical protein VMS18_21065 [Candidatus Binatia bacterium]|nr:hypothetical protein [Candidatus Binatia bacterium]